GYIKMYNIPNNTGSAKIENQFFGRQIPNFNLPIVNGNGSNSDSFIFIPSEDNKYYLFIFFTPWDCQSCFDEIPFWRQLKNKFNGRLNVIGIGAANSLNLLRHFVNKNDISILTIFDENEYLFSLLGLNESGLTPAKILVNSRGAILNLNPSTHKNNQLQQKYITLIDRIIPNI
ncbi:unnamed protein product, partial [marine sediment metagenome]